LTDAAVVEQVDGRLHLFKPRRRRATIAFGPVTDPKGGRGVRIIPVTDDYELSRLQKRDPAMRICSEASSMPTVIVGSRHNQAFRKQVLTNRP
jgi:hypothetical protein